MQKIHLKTSRSRILQITCFILIIIVHTNCKRSSNDFNVNEIEINKNTRGITYLYNEKPISGTVYERSDSDILLKAFEVDNGILSGSYREYYNSGNLKLEQFYSSGKLEGVSKSFYEDGSTKEMLNYSNGLLTGERSYFWSNGLLKESNQFEKGIMTGENTYFFSNGQIQKKFELDQYGRRHGLWEDYYSNGQIKEISEYKNGQIILEKVRYSEDGSIIK